VQSLTPAERRGALLVLVLLTLGSIHDLWRATRPLPAVVPSRVLEPGGAASAADTAPGPGPDPVPASGASPTGPALDLNRASARELDALPGIGPVLAARIIDHREREGRFARPEELLAVRGIGPKLFARLRPRVTVGAPIRVPDRAPYRAPDTSLYKVGPRH
jgi:competence protein ComEA